MAVNHVGEFSSIEELLNAPIDPNSQPFWEDLRHCILTSKGISSLNRRSVLNLKLIFSELPNNLHGLSSMSHLLKLIKPSLKAEIGGDIGSIINEIVFDRPNVLINDVSEFLSSVCYVASDNFKMKRSILDELIGPFFEYLRIGKLSSFDPIVLSSLFNLLIILISQCPENRTLISQYLNETHISQCVNIIKKCEDSLTQMLISEWLWRSFNSLPKKPNINQIFGGLSDSFNQISLSNFRGSLHTFVVDINQHFQSSVIHIPFNGMVYNGHQVDLNGWIDLNPQTIGIWIMNQPASNRSNIPDVVVLKNSMVYNVKAEKKRLEFSTKEKVDAFNFISRDKPIQMQFSVQNSLTKNTIEEIMSKFQKKKMNQIESAKSCPKKTLGTLSKEVNRNANLTAGKKRIYAHNGKKKQDLDLDDGSKALDLDLGNDEDFLYGKTTQEKEVKMKMIEQMLTGFQRKTIDSINSVESAAKMEVEDIITKLAENMRVLSQMADQHKDLTELTQKENEVIAETVAKLEKEFQERNDETSQKRNSITMKVNTEIENERGKFVQETDAAFEDNAIIGLSNHLSTLRESMCDIPA